MIEGWGKYLEACAAISLVVSAMISVNLVALDPNDSYCDRFAASSAKPRALFHSSIFLYFSFDYKNF